ncbi:hypothetical protein PTKIN_Ptkin12aG0048100 [Pterospermum kingtungense]
MGKRKIEIKFIENEKARKRVFEKRKKSLVKKAKELSILCDIKLLLIIYELGKQTPEIWPGNDEEAAQIVNRYKQQHARGGSKKPCPCCVSKKKGFAKFALSDLKNMINHLPENELKNLCSELDVKIAAVMNAIESKQVSTGPSAPKMLSDSQGIGSLLNEGKGKEVVMHQEPVHTLEDQSFHMLSHNPNFMESPMMMMMMPNGISNPEFDGSSTSTNAPYHAIPVHYVDPSWMQLAYMNSDSSVGYYEPTMYHIPPGIYYPVMPVAGFPSQVNQ